MPNEAVNQFQDVSGTKYCLIEPAVGVVVTAKNLKTWNEVHVLTGANGRYRLAVAQGNYDILAQAEVMGTYSRQ